MKSRVATICFALVLLAFALPSFASPCVDPGSPAVFPEPPAAYTHVATKTGNWHDSSVWNAGTVPGNGSIVCIPSGIRVTVASTSSSSDRVRFVRVEGEMRMWIHSSTSLYVETIYVDSYNASQASTGIFMIGASGNPVKDGVVARIVFLNDGTHLKNKSTWDPKQLSRGFISDGRVRMYGKAKTHAVSMDADALSGATTLSLDSTPTWWEAGDEVVVTGSYFRRGSASRDELRTLQYDVGTSTAYLGSSLSYDHVRPDSNLYGADPRLHVANLTRNIVFESESTANPWRRGHVMFRDPDVHVEYVRFEGLGRTDKSIPLDDVDVNTSTGAVSIPSAGTYSNPRGRYAVHFHENGIQAGSAPPSQVHGCAVVDTAGWGYVSHSSHVDFAENVAYDFAGAGFVAEAGDELGNFHDNVAIRGTGDGVFNLVRIVFNNNSRPQPLGDFGFRGDGFWFQGPALSVKDNVANGCDGAGMIWFTTGVPETFQSGGSVVNRYVGFPRGDVSSAYSAAGTPNPNPTYLRNWNHDSNQIVVSDLPILEMDGLDSYGNFIGFKLRFNNDDAVDWYKEDPYDYDLRIVSPGTVSRVRQEVANLNLWNNEQAYRARYIEKTDWSGVTAINRLDYDVAGDPTRGHYGAETNFQILNTTFTDLRIDGYPVSAWIEATNDNVRNQLTFYGAKDFRHYANQDTDNPNLSCAVPTSVGHSLVTSSSARISWTASTDNVRFTVRYRASGDQQWEYAPSPGPSTGSYANLSGLSSGTTYSYQVVAGCSQSGEESAVSNWTSAGSFTTP